MRFGFRSPIYRIELKAPPPDFVRDRTALELASRTAAEKLQLRIDGKPKYNSKHRKFLKSISFPVSGKQGAGYLKVRGHTGMTQLFGGEDQIEFVSGVARPQLLEKLNWSDRGTNWQALLMSRSPGPAISEDQWLPAGTVLPEDFFLRIKQNLKRLAEFDSPRMSSHTVLLTQFFLKYRKKVPPLTELTFSHSDLHWSNLSNPLCLFDWEDCGSAPRGFDAAYLLAYSLADAEACKNIRAAFKDDLECSSGMASRLFCLDIQLQLIARKFKDPSYKPLVEAELRNVEAELR